MADSTYQVRVNRSQGTVEILGPDKEWISEQLDRLMPVLLGEFHAPDDVGDGGTSDAPESAEPTGGAPAPADHGKPKRTRRTGSTTVAKSNSDLAVKLTDDVKTKLHAYLEQRKAKAKDAQTQAPVIATFLLDEINWPDVTGDDLHTVYSEMGWKIPSTRSALSNAQKRKGYFTTPNDGRYKVSHSGQNFARHDSKD